MLDKKVSEIIESGRSNILDLQEILLKSIQQNTSDFFQNIKLKDYEKAQKNINWGLDWQSKKTLQQIRETFENSFQDIIAIKMLWELKPDNIPDEILLDFFKTKNPLKPKEVIVEIFKKRIEKGYYQALNEDVGLWFLDKTSILSLDEKALRKNIMSTLLLRYDLEKCEKLLDTIYSKSPELIIDSLGTAMKEGNFNFIIKKYSFLLDNTSKSVDKKNIFHSIINRYFVLFNKISNPVDTEKMMAEALEKGNLNIIRFLNKKGQPYPNTKAPYSGLFGNVAHKEAMEYVVNTIEDITVGNQVILRTALHYNREKIIIPILERYNKSQYDQISKATEKREENEALQMINYFNFKNNLENNLDNSKVNNKKNFSPKI